MDSYILILRLVIILHIVLPNRLYDYFFCFMIPALTPHVKKKAASFLGIEIKIVLAT